MVSYQNSDIMLICQFLQKLYYALIYPFLIYGIITWGNTYPTTIQPLSVLQKKEVRIMTFSKFHEHSSRLFKNLNIIKLSDLIKYHISIFMFNNQLLPSVFNPYLTSVENIHSYNTRATAKMCYYLPKVRTLIMDCSASDIKDLKFGI